MEIMKVSKIKVIIMQNGPFYINNRVFLDYNDGYIILYITLMLPLVTVRLILISF